MPTYYECMINIIDRYIARLFLVYFISGILVFVTIFLAVDFLSMAVKNDASMAILLKYYAYYLPSVAYQMVPIACLLATVFTLSSLNKSSELVALFSMGMSLARVSLPILTLVSMITAFSFWMGDHLLPGLNQKKNYVLYVEIKKKPGLYSTVKTNKIWYRSENILFNIQILNAATKSAHGISLYYFDPNWQLNQIISAKKVRMLDNIWELTDGRVTLFSEDFSFPLVKSFDRKKVAMSEEIADLQSATHSSDVLSIKKLKKFIKKNKESGLETLEYEVDYLGKYGFVFSAFVMSIMGIPFSVNQQRSGGTMANAGICLGLTFIFWAMYSSFISMGKYGVIPPIMAAWGADVIMLVASVYFLLRLKK